jgi:hypothetical protein
MCVEISPKAKERQEALMGFVLEEIKKAGGTFAKKDNPAPATTLEREPCA